MKNHLLNFFLWKVFLISVIIFTNPLNASTYLGGSGTDGGWPRTVSAVDDRGNIYVAGCTASANFPMTIGAYDESYNNGVDVFVAKMSGDLTTLLASTFIGGNMEDRALSIAIDQGGYVYVTGLTKSANFPVTSGVYDNSFGGSSDVFIVKLNPDLTVLLASTFLGSSSSDEGTSIALDKNGNVRVAGKTRSNTFPTTAGAYDVTFNGSYNTFISKLDNDLTMLLASTFLGSSCIDDYPAMVLDQSDDVFVAGTTASASFPTTPAAYDRTLGGGLDIYVARLTGDLTALLASTYLGGNSYDMGYAIALDQSKHVYVTSHAAVNFPTSTNAYDRSFNGGIADANVAKFDSSLTTLLASTYLGGNANDCAMFVKADADGDVFVSGFTESSNFPATVATFDNSYNGNVDAFIVKFDAELKTLIASTFIGGSDVEDGNFLTLDKNGAVYIVGATGSSDFPVIPGAFEDSYQGGSTGSWGGDVYISKLDKSLSAAATGVNKPTPPEEFELFGNYPNPFNAVTTIEYQILKPGTVKIQLFNLMGQKINTLIDEFHETGNYKVIWNGYDYSRNNSSSGVYFYQLEANGIVDWKKMLLLR